MGKVNEAREFKSRRHHSVVGFATDSNSIWELNATINHPFRLEYRLYRADKEVFDTYLSWVLTAVFGVSSTKIRNTYNGDYVRYHITLNVEKKDLEIIDKFLFRALDGLKKIREGKIFELGKKA
jgi:hypothetical protein